MSPRSCSITLLPLPEKDAEAACGYMVMSVGNDSYLTTAANLWTNRVTTQLPTLSGL